MDLPTKEECEELFEKYHVPKHIRRHCRKVNRLAVFLAEKLKEKGVDIDTALTDRLSLLHDLWKVITIKEEDLNYEKFKEEPAEKEKKKWAELREVYPDKQETEIGYEEMKKVYPEFAEVILSEGDLTVLPSRKRIEEQVVMYADMKILSEEIVSLKERAVYIEEKYMKKQQEHGIDWQEVVEDLFRIKQKIFQKLGFSPEKLPEKIEEIES